MRAQIGYPRSMDLTVTDLALARGGLAVLSGVSFGLAAGRALVLRGPNGVGKTTLLRTIAGLQAPLAGKIAPGPDQIAYAAHADAVKGALSVAENLRFWAHVYGAAGIEAALGEMQLQGLRDRPAQTLSAGQRRRLGLARLMLSDRPIWLLDEPTVSLDAASVALFRHILAQHMGRGGSALLATHIDLGLPHVEMLDLTCYSVAKQGVAPALGPAGFDEAFL